MIIFPERYQITEILFQDSDILEYTVLSPQDGVVTFIGAEEGGLASAGEFLFEVQNPERLEITADIDEVDLSYIQNGQRVKIISDSFIGKELQGNVESIEPVIRQKGDNRVCTIHISISEDKDRLARIGASCSIFITVETKDDVPSIPVESFFTEDGKKMVFLLKGTGIPDVYTLEKRKIETGILGIENVEVVDGLTAGDKILSSGFELYEEGEEVKAAGD